MHFKFLFQVLLGLCCVRCISAEVADKDMTRQQSWKHGVLLLTYDDRNFSGWLDALPLFEKYGAHATFFASGVMDKKAISAMLELQKHGHSVGLHSLHHKNAPAYIKENGADNYLKKEILSQLKPAKKAGLKINSFAYPNNSRTEETDKILSPYFKRFRAGLGLGLGRKPGRKWSKIDKAFQPVDQLASRKVFGGMGLGEFYYTDKEELRNVLHRIAERNEVLVIFSHNIAPDAKKIHTPVDTLEMMLSLAKELNIAVVGFDDLP